MTTLDWLQAGTVTKGQLRIISFFNILDTLQQRGFQGVSEGSMNDTLLTPKAHPSLDTNAREGRLAAIRFLGGFNDKEYRILVRKMIFQGIKLDSPDGVEFEFEKTSENEQRYGKTVELLLAYQCVQELKAFSASFGVHIGEAPGGGDYDCIANFQNSLYHFEVKSGDASNVDRTDLQNFLARHDYLAPEATILFLDYQGIPNGVIEQFHGLTVGQTHRVEKIYKVETGAGRLFAIWPGVVVVDLSRNGNILKNFRAAMRYLERYKAQIQAFFAVHIDPRALGYDSEEL